MNVVMKLTLPARRYFALLSTALLLAATASIPGEAAAESKRTGSGATPVRKQVVKRTRIVKRTGIVQRRRVMKRTRKVVVPPGVRMIQGMKVQDLRPGRGPVAQNGKRIVVDYRGRLANGTIFDESYKRGEPFSFTLGAGEVIQGWDKGFVGMRVGGKRRLTIPPALGYGASGAGGVIPPNATLIFDVELRDVQS